jgi:hypothetical protein
METLNINYQLRTSFYGITLRRDAAILRRHRSTYNRAGESTLGLYAGTAGNFLTNSLIPHADGKHLYYLAFDLIGQRGRMFLQLLRLKRAVVITIFGQFESSCGVLTVLWSIRFTIVFKVLSHIEVKFRGQSIFCQQID